MKKLFAILMMVCLGVFVIGCGPKDKKPETTGTSAAGSSEEPAGGAAAETPAPEEGGTETPAP
jgi:hypothetical protein